MCWPSSAAHRPTGWRMANGRGAGRKGDTARVSGGFVALPWAVLDCAAYADLSHPARSLLVEIARQYVRGNNGRLLASSAHLAKRGWSSADVITRAKRELVDAGFIHETVRGHRPNKASWYAVTWYLLDHHQGYDPGAAATFNRGSYERPAPLKNAALRPSHGVERPAIAPSHGVERRPPTPSHGAIKATLPPSSTPSHGNHLDMPSAGVVEGDDDGKHGEDRDGEPPEFDRERECEIDASRFDPITGEFSAVPEAPSRLTKQTAAAVVAAGLASLKTRRSKGARQE